MLGKQRNSFDWYSIEYPTNHLYFLGIHTSLCTMPGKKTVAKTVRQCDIRVAHDGKIGCNTVEYTMTFLCSDWLYFLWHGINEESKRRGSLPYEHECQNDLFSKK